MREARLIMADLAAAGLTPEQMTLMMELGAAIAAEARPVEDRAANRRRAKDRAYQAERRQNRQKSADAPLNEDTSKPRPSETKVSSGLSTAPADFPRPEWADPQVWKDFLTNRKRKRLPNTASAHKAFLADIDRIADDEWPPGRLLEHAAAKGWGSINDPRKPLDNRNGQSASRQGDNLRGSRPDPAIDLIRSARRDEEAERSLAPPDRGAWPSLPAIGSG